MISAAGCINTVASVSVSENGQWPHANTLMLSMRIMSGGRDSAALNLIFEWAALPIFSYTLRGIIRTKRVRKFT